MQRKLYTTFALVLVLLLTVTACAPQVAETPAATEAAVTEAAATEAAATEAVEAAPEDPWGNIVFAPGTEVKLAVSSALTAGYAVYGQDMLNGATLAAENFGKLKGWDVVVEGGDDQCEGAPGVTVAEKFAADPTVLGVLGPMCSGTVVAAAVIYNENNMVMISPSSTAIMVTARGHENVFRTVANDDLQAEVTVDFIVNEKGAKKLSLLHDQSTYGQGIAEAVAEKFKAAGGEVLAIEGITRGDVDFSAVVSTVLAGEPDAVYWGGMDAEGALLVKQLRDAGFEGVFFGPDGIKSVPSYVEAAGGAAEGSFMTFGAVGGATGYEEFEAQFVEKFGDKPVAYGPGTYDAATIMLKAADAVATVDASGNLVIGRKALADKVRELPFDGVTGHLEFDDKGDLKVVSITVFTATTDDIVPVKTYDFGK